MYRKRDIVIIPVPFTNNLGSKMRPALVISNDKVHKTGDVIVVQITSKEKQDGFSIRITDDDVSELLPKTSYIRCHKIFVIEATLIKLKVSQLNTTKYNEVIELISEIIH